MREKEREKREKLRERKSERVTDHRKGKNGEREERQKTPELGAGSMSLPPMSPPQPCQSRAWHRHARPSKKREGQI